MLEVIYGGVFGITCFIAGCFLTWRVCKYYENIAIEAKVEKRTNRPVSSVNYNPVRPVRMPKPVVEYEEDDEDDDEVS